MPTTPRAATNNKTRRRNGDLLNFRRSLFGDPGRVRQGSRRRKQGSRSAVWADDVTSRNSRLRQRRPESERGSIRGGGDHGGPLQERADGGTCVRRTPAYDGLQRTTDSSQSTIGPAEGFPVDVAGIVATRQLSSMALDLAVPKDTALGKSPMPAAATRTAPHPTGLPARSDLTVVPAVAVKCLRPRGPRSEATNVGRHRASPSGSGWSKPPRTTTALKPEANVWR
jgi:hypothetical protein